MPLQIRPIPTLSTEVQAQFWSFVARGDEDACWPWTRSLSEGYGTFRSFKVHRVAYALMVGAIPEGLTLDHLCRNRACVNPRHLEPVTAGVNTLRGRTVTAENVTKTHCPKGHPYDGQNVMVRRGRRICHACQLEMVRNWRTNLAKKATIERCPVCQRMVCYRFGKFYMHKVPIGRDRLLSEYCQGSKGNLNELKGVRNV